jgi:O-methyltransferase involved in polyketide biosynthesis
MAERLVDVFDGEEAVLHTYPVTRGTSDGLPPDNHLKAVRACAQAELVPDADRPEFVGKDGESPSASDIGVRGSSIHKTGSFKPDLAGVPETMLWALHNRAVEARRADGVLDDPDSVTIHEAIDYDFAGHFGVPAGSLAARAAEIDRQLRAWLDLHPDGLIVSLGEGLETQVRRVDNGRMRWLSVDLPDAMRMRERFLRPTDRFWHIAVSALDPAWMDEVDPSSGVFVVAQGLLMYFEPDVVRRLLVGIADRFPGAEIVFDAVPRWFSRLTLQGLYQTPGYRLPLMPWGIDRDELQPTLRGWDRRLGAVTILEYSAPRGFPRLAAQLVENTPIARHAVPSLVRVTVCPATSQIPAIPNLMQPENDQMTVENHPIASPGSIGGLLAAATRTAGLGSDIAIATGQVIAKRMALGLEAARNPRSADREEFGRMVPEKVEAFSAASTIMLEQSGRAGRQVAQFASTEMAATTRAAMAMTECASPMAFAQAQGEFVRSWFERASSSFVAMGVMALSMQDAAMAPIRATVVANAERLGR